MDLTSFEADATLDLQPFLLRLMSHRAEALRSVARALNIPLPPRTEAERLDAIRARAVPPASCGPEMPVAPARGPLRAVQPLTMVRTADGYDAVHTGFRGRDAGRVRDIFDLMADQARRAGGFDPFTQRQKDTARLYAAMVERHSSVGLKGRSIEAVSSRSGRGGDGVMDAILEEGRRISFMRAAVGDGLALQVKRQGKAARSAIRTLHLVDLVCIEGRSISDVLAKYGWPSKGQTRAEAQDSLARALDAMATTS